MSKPTFLEVVGRGLHQVLNGRPRSLEREAMVTVSQTMQLAIKYASMDAGLITATGKSRLEETHGLQVFEEMRRDSQIKAALSVKKFAVLAGHWEVTPYDDSEEAAKQADFVRWNLKEILGDRGLGLEPVMTAFDYGRSVCELVYEVAEYGPHKGNIMVKRIKPKNIGFVDFDMDDFNNIKAFISQPLQGDPVRIPPEKVVHYTWDAQFDNPYGCSDLTSCWSWYWAKKTLYKYFLIFADKYASPIPVIELEKNLSSSDATALDNAAKEYHISNYFKLPKGVKMQFHQNSGTAGAVYLDGIRECDSQMARAILSQTLTINENRRTGTHAQAEVHQTTLGIILAKVQNDVERAVIYEQIIKPLINLNFPNVQGYPTFQFQSLEPEFLDKVSTVIDKLTKVTDEKGNQFISPREPWIRKYLGIPSRDEKEFPWSEEIVLTPEQMVAKETADADRELAEKQGAEKKAAEKKSEKNGKSNGKGSAKNVLDLV